MKAKYQPRARVDSLSPLQELELMLGLRSRAGLEHFEGDTHAEDVWRLHRDRLYREYGEIVERWWACRRFDRGERCLPTDDELTVIVDGQPVVVG